MCPRVQLLHSQSKSNRIKPTNTAVDGWNARTATPTTPEPRVRGSGVLEAYVDPVERLVGAARHPGWRFHLQLPAQLPPRLQRQKWEWTHF